MWKKNLVIFIAAALFLTASGCRRSSSDRSRRQRDVNTGSTYYTVQPKDTLYRISRKFGISIDYLVKVNEISDRNILKVGQRLYVGKDSVSGIPKVRDQKSGAINRKKTVRKPVTESSDSSAGRSAFLVKPVESEVLYSYGEDVNGIRNEGITYRISDNGEVRSAARGAVVYVDRDSGLIIIEHSKDYYTVYSGMHDISVKMGDKVKSGENIGRVSAGTELYFELRRLQQDANPRAMNPQLYFL
ncbi:MAG: peptidoglycan DD-metalloendopeptidase family protein [Candidatus Muiribacteriaceae bacterium]